MRLQQKQECFLNFCVHETQGVCWSQPSLGCNQVAFISGCFSQAEYFHNKVEEADQKESELLTCLDSRAGECPQEVALKMLHLIMRSIDNLKRVRPDSTEVRIKLCSIACFVVLLEVCSYTTQVLDMHLI